MFNGEIETLLHPYAYIDDETIIDAIALHMVFANYPNPVQYSRAWHDSSWESLNDIRYWQLKRWGRERVDGWFEEAGARASTAKFADQIYRDVIRPTEDELRDSHYRLIASMMAEDGDEFENDLVYHPAWCSGECLEDPALRLGC